MAAQNNQFSRYGGIARTYPFTTGKLFFLMNSTEARLPSFNSDYPADNGGATRVVTTWAAAIAATTAGNFDVIYVSPSFTTAPTLSQVASLDANGVSVYQMGQINPDGTYFCTKASSGLPASTTKNLFQVNGRIELLNIGGRSNDRHSGTGQRHEAYLGGTIGAAVDLCSTGDINAAAVGTQLSITGTLATALQITPASALVRQATPVVVTAGIIRVSCAATNTGAVKWKMVYKPIDAGAFVSAL